MTAELYYNPFVPAFSNTGVAISGAKLYFFLTGSVTASPVYTDATLTTALPHPVEADLAGKYPDIYLDSTVTYRVRQTDADGVSLGDDIDPYIPGQALKGDTGATGPVANTYTDLVTFKAQDVTNKVATLKLTGSDAVSYSWVEGDFSAITPDDSIYIESDDNALTVGVWRKSAFSTGLVTTSAKAYSVDGSFAGAQAQTMIDDHIYRLDGPARNEMVVFGWGDVVLSEALNIGYGISGFQSLNVSGVGAPNNGSTSHFGDTLNGEAITAGAIVNMQGLRNSKISNFTVMGAAFTDLNVARVTFDIADPDAVFDTALTDAGVTPGSAVAPYSGIAVDPKSGTDPGASRAPSISYPTDLFPGQSGDTYELSLSSRLTFEDIQFSGTEVGLVVHPNLCAGNGDWSDFQGQLLFDGVKYGVSFCDDQNRIINFHGLFRDVHTCFVNTKHGEQDGKLPHHSQIGIASFCYQIIDIADPSNNSHTIAVEGEAIVRIGDISGGGATTAGALHFDLDCSFRNSSVNGIPAVQLGGSSCRSLVSFTGHIDITGAGYFEPRNVVFDKLIVKQRDDQTKTYAQHFYNATGGGIFVNLVQNKNKQVVGYSPTELGTSSNPDMKLTDEYYPYTGRDYCIPYFMSKVKHETCHSESIVHNYTTGLRYYLCAGSQLTSMSRSGTALSFTNGRISGVDVTQNRGLVNGSIWWHDATGILATPRSTNTGTGAQVLELMSGYKGSDLIQDESLIFNGSGVGQGNWYCVPANLYAPERLLVGTFTSGSPTITNVKSVGGIATNYGLTVGDRLAMEWLQTTGLISATGGSDSSISAIDTGAATITLNRNAATDATDVPLPVWFRAPPADEASR